MINVVPQFLTLNLKLLKTQNPRTRNFLPLTSNLGKLKMFTFDFLEQKLILCGNQFYGRQPQKNYSNAGVGEGEKQVTVLGKKGKTN